MRSHALTPVHTKSDAGRISVPKQFSEHVSWLTGTDTVQSWILLLNPGRYRVLSDEQVLADAYLQPIRALLLEGTPVVPTGASSSERSENVAVVAKLVPISISPPESSGPGWRISLPKVFDEFVPEGCDPKAFTVLFSLEGYLEIWNTEVLRRAVLQESRP
jgi:hypothetical protein